MNLFDVYPLYNINIVKGDGCKVWDKNRKCHHKYIDAAEKPYYFQIGVVSRKIFLHDEVAAESDGVPCHKHRDTDSQGFSPTPLQRVSLCL